MKQNRDHIHSEINRRKKEKDNIIAGQKYSSPGYGDVYMGKNMHYSRLEERSAKERAGRKNRRNTTSADEETSPEVFLEIQKIINNKISPSESHNKIDLNHVQHSVKLAKLLQNIRRLSPDKSISQIRSDLELERSMVLHKN